MSVSLPGCLSLSVSLSPCLSVCLLGWLPVCLSTCVPARRISVILVVRLSIGPSACLPNFLSVYRPSVCLSVYLFVCPSVCLSAYLPVYLSATLSARLSVFLLVVLSACLSFCLCISLQTLYLSVCYKWSFFYLPFCISIYRL